MYIESSKLPSPLRAKLDKLTSYLNSNHLTGITPTTLVNDLVQIIGYLKNTQDNRDVTEKYARLNFLLHQKNDGITNDDVYSLIYEDRTTEDSDLLPRDWKLEKKIRVIEDEIARLSSNPALENKLSKVERQLTEIRSLEDKLANSPIAMLQSKVTKLERDLNALSQGTIIEEQSIEDRFNAYENAKRKVFVIMPFAEQFDDVWHGAIESACKSEDYYCLRVDEISLSSGITNDIKKCVDIANVVIADITGNNPNVLFELGWALAKGKEAIIIKQKDDSKIAFDIEEYRYIPYLNKWSGVERLSKDISKFLKAIEKSIEKKPKKDI